MEALVKENPDPRSSGRPAALYSACVLHQKAELAVSMIGSKPPSRLTERRIELIFLQLFSSFIGKFPAGGGDVFFSKLKKLSHNVPPENFSHPVPARGGGAKFIFLSNVQKKYFSIKFCISSFFTPYDRRRAFPLFPGICLTMVIFYAFLFFLFYLCTLTTCVSLLFR